MITDLGFSATKGSPMDINVGLTASSYDIATIEIDFKDGEYEINYGDYHTIKEEYGNPEDMTYNEFNDKVMVENL